MKFFKGQSKLLRMVIKIQTVLLLSSLLFPLTLHASIIESTMGAAVVNDATATYYNPAALVLLKKPQIVDLNSFSRSNSQFTGQSTQAKTGFTQSGSTNTHTNYYLPSFYLGIPATDRITFGFGAISNFFDKDIDGNSILRYAQSNNSVKNIDLVSALEFKLNDIASLGAAIDASYADFLLNRLVGFPSLNIPDSQSNNQADGTGVGEDVGFLLRATKSTLVGINYRSAVTYRLSGKSVFESNPEVISDNYGFTFWTPARIVLSVSQALTHSLGIIGTVQRIEWSIFDEINIHGIATEIGNQPAILNAAVPFHLHDAWLLTLGTNYRLTPKWVFRVAGSFNQSPGNSNVQITNGDSFILGGSVGYQIFKNIIIDGGYAHAFIQKDNIHVATGPNLINGVTTGSVNVVSLKLTLNLG